MRRRAPLGLVRRRGRVSCVGREVFVVAAACLGNLAMGATGCSAARSGTPAADDGGMLAAEAGTRDSGERPADARAEAGKVDDAKVPLDAVRTADVVEAMAAGDAAEACSDGVPVAYTRTSCAGTPAPVPAALASSAGSGSLGDIVSLGGLDDPSLPCFPVRVCVAKGAPTLVFSDDPESPAADGVLYADALEPGAYRAYVYHSNAGADVRKFPAVLLNEGSATVHVTVTAKGVAGPSEDYVDVGKQALLRLMSPTSPATADVPPGQRVLLDADLDQVHAATNELAHAIIDFTLDGPVKLSVVSVLASEDATIVTSGLPLLPGDGLHVRGTFPGAALEMENLAPLDGEGARHLRLGGNVTDESRVGNDYVDGTIVTLDGNYGVTYALRLGFAPSVTAALVLSPQGGGWGGAAAVASSGGASAGPAAVPSSADSLGTQTDAIVLGSFGAGAHVVASFASAGGSSLPVDLVVLPLP